MKQYTENEKSMLNKVNEIGMQLNALDEDFIFIILFPHLDQLMQLLKQLQPSEMQILFMQYEGVMKVMRMMEDCAQEIENCNV